MGLEDFSSTDKTRQADSKKITEAGIYKMFLETAEKCGEDFTKDDLRKHNNGLHPTTVKKHTGKTINEVKEHLSLKQNMKSAPNEQQISSELTKLTVPVTKSKVNAHCSFSASIVSKKYGDGSFVDGLIHLGINVTDNQLSFRDANRERNNNNGKSYKYCSNLVKTHPDYDKSAEGFIYRLKCTRSGDGRVFWYVGQTEEGSSLVSRVYEHIIKGGNFTGVSTVDSEHSQLDGIDITDDSVDFNIELDSIYPVYKYELFSKVFQKALNRIEFKTIVKTGIEKDTTNVIGTV